MAYGSRIERYSHPSKRIDMPDGCATYFNNDVFKEVLPRLGRRFSKVRRATREPHLQIVYLALYTACFHKSRKEVRLSIADIARMTGIDARTVQRDLGAARRACPDHWWPVNFDTG